MVEDRKITGKSLWGDAWSRIRGNKVATLCLWVIILFTITSCYGTVVYWRYNIIDKETPRFLEPVKKVFVKILRAESVTGRVAPYQRQNLEIRYQKPSFKHLMGTDGLGRDVALRLIQGCRIAFQVGIVTSLIAIPIGVIFGCLAGYFGGKVDDIIVWMYSTFACMPSLLFILSVSMVVGKGLLGVYLGIGLTTWVYLCRLVRAETLKHKEFTYVKAARALGLGHFRIMFRHILPNIMHLIIINFSLRFPAAISIEVIMSYLGIGVQGEPSWGIMINNARFRLWHGVWWELGFTTIAIFLVVLAFNLFGDILRDALDPRLRSQDERG
ncbi:ABC transporter permease [Verrucomicrobiota bacterium]